MIIVLRDEFPVAKSIPEVKDAKEAWLDPNGMKVDVVVRVINDVTGEKELVGLTVAEYMHRMAIRIKNMLEQLPLLK